LFLAWLARLKNLGVVVVVVWDGKSLPGKQYTKKSRMENVYEAEHQLESYLEHTRHGYSGNIICLQICNINSDHFYSTFTFLLIQVFLIIL
jgi:hypothetical protein